MSITSSRPSNPFAADPAIRLLDRKPLGRPRTRGVKRPFSDDLSARISSLRKMIDIAEGYLRQRPLDQYTKGRLERLEIELRFLIRVRSELKKKPEGTA
jgi:hypothetical protein